MRTQLEFGSGWKRVTREDNIFRERQEGRIAAARAAALATGDVVTLPLDVVHSVANPIEQLTGAIHIYGGDFFATSRTP